VPCDIKPAAGPAAETSRIGREQFGIELTVEFVQCRKGARVVLSADHGIAEGGVIRARGRNHGLLFGDDDTLLDFLKRVSPTTIDTSAT